MTLWFSRFPEPVLTVIYFRDGLGWKRKRHTGIFQMCLFCFTLCSHWGEIRMWENWEHWECWESWANKTSHWVRDSVWRNRGKRFDCSFRRSTRLFIREEQSNILPHFCLTSTLKPASPHVREHRSPSYGASGCRGWSQPPAKNYLTSKGT